MQKHLLNYFVYSAILIIILTLLVLGGSYLYTKVLPSNESILTSDDFFLWTWKDGPVLSRVDYRFFACGQEYHMTPTADSDVGQSTGIFRRSTGKSMILDGTPSIGRDTSLMAFFEAIGGKLLFPVDHRGIMIKIPTESGILEFNNSHTLCENKKIELRVFRHHLIDPEDIDSLKESILWKYTDYSFRNNYGTVPPGDCLTFVFDTEEELEKNWPVCTAYRKQ